MLLGSDANSVGAVFTQPDALNHASKHYDGPGNLRNQHHLLALHYPAGEPQITAAATEVVQHRRGSKALFAAGIKYNCREGAAYA